MFETLERPEQPASIGLQLLFYGIYGFAGLVFVVLGVRGMVFRNPSVFRFPA
jgi:hypothetical protein